MQIDWDMDADLDDDAPVRRLAQDCITLLDLGNDVEPDSAASFPDFGFLSVIHRPADPGPSLTIHACAKNVAVSAAPDPLELGGASYCVWSTESS